MYYNARWYDPSLGRFAQADSIVPPGVQGLDRYAYVNNSPMNHVDPSGHEPGDCYDRGYCNYGDMPPSKLIEREQDRRIDCELQGLGDCQPNYGYSKLTDDIEKYLQSHPDYDPKKDGMFDKWGNETSIGFEFDYQRRVYWEKRAREAGLCTICESLANKLTAYYDSHQEVIQAGWKMPDLKVIGMDVAMIPLSFYGGGYRLLNSKFVSGAVGFATTSSSFAGLVSGDPIVAGASAIGLYPPAAPFAAFFILEHDLLKGGYTYSFAPPMSR